MIIKSCNIVFFFLAVMCLVSLYADQQDQTKKDDGIITEVVEVSSEIIVPKIKLFMYEGCSYCVKVKFFLEKYNLLDTVEFIDAGVFEHKELLRAISGKTQAPYVVDTYANINMAESDDIIKYLAEKFKIEDYKKDSISPFSNIDNSQKQHDIDTFLRYVCASLKPVVILVSTTWCPPCKVFKPIFISVVQEMSELFEFILVDGDTNRKIVEQLGVRGYPTVVFYKNGKRIDIGYDRSKSGFIKALQNLL